MISPFALLAVGVALQFAAPARAGGTVAPANKTIVVTLANGMANSGYIYSDEAYSHLTFQVIGSRLQPGCAEKKIVSAAIELMHRSGE